MGLVEETWDRNMADNTHRSFAGGWNPGWFSCRLASQDCGFHSQVVFDYSVDTRVSAFISRVKLPTENEAVICFAEIKVPELGSSGLLPHLSWEDGNSPLGS